MLNATELAKHITVNYRGQGFLNLSLPTEMFQTGMAAQLGNLLREATGIEHVSLDDRDNWIAIRFDSHIISTAGVAKNLFAAIEQQLETLPQEARPPEDEIVTSDGYDFAKDGFQPWLDKIKTLILPPMPVEEGSMRARFQPMLESALTEKAITNFFNDIVAFYLVKVHWELITKRWLKEPAAFSNAWLTVFYMIFLLIRYRKSP